MKRFCLACFVVAALAAMCDLAAIVADYASERFVFSRDAVTAGSNPMPLPTQGVSLRDGRVIVGLHALSADYRTECGWYLYDPSRKPVAQSNEVWRVSGYDFDVRSGRAIARWDCAWRKVAAKRYSKLDIITTLKTVNGVPGDANAWVSVRRAIEAADLMDEWNACTYLAEDHPLFAALRAQAAQITGMSEAQIAALLERCIY